MKYIAIVLIITSCLLPKGLAQNDIFFARNATLKLNGKFENKPLIGTTNKLGVKLDYETTELTLKISLSSIKFNNDTINKLLQNENMEIVFNGDLSLDFINTEGHPPLYFTIEGWIDSGGSEIKIVGNGELHHTNDSGNYVCMLGLSIYIDLNDFNIDIPHGLSNEVGITIQQALLEKDKN